MTHPKKQIKAQSHPHPPSIQVKTGLGQSIKQGIGLGVGSSIGQHLVGYLFPSHGKTQSITPPAVDCKKTIEAYDLCLTTSDCSAESMRSLLDRLVTCQQSNSNI